MCEICWAAERQVDGRLRWDRALINRLPDEAFAVIEPDYKTGRTRNKNARHLPHHTAGVRRGLDSRDGVDLAHLRSAVETMNRITPVTDSMTADKLRQLAREHFAKHTTELQAIETPAPNSLSADRQTGRAELSLPAGVSLMEDGSMTTCLVSPISTVDASGLSSEAKLAVDAEGIVGRLRPQEGDFIYVTFRELSKTILPGRFLNFTIGDVLKNSIGMLVRKPVFPNHHIVIENALGAVTEEVWNEDGDPPGIDATYKIDALANPRVARSLLMEPPAISSTSITVKFSWEQSHPDMDEVQFFFNLGKEIDGRLVTIDVTEITAKPEASLVWSGADPFAKIKKVAG